MPQSKVMAWVERLPEVGDAIHRRRQAIEDKVKDAERLEFQAKEIRSQAYFDGLALEARIGELWTPEQISQAKGA